MAWIDDIRQGVVIVLCGVLIKSAGSLMKEDVFSLVLTTIGIIAFIWPYLQWTVNQRNLKMCSWGGKEKITGLKSIIILRNSYPFAIIMRIRGLMILTFIGVI